MRFLVKSFFLLSLTIGFVALCAFQRVPGIDKASITFSYKQAGLTEREAAAHLLSRFTYGATPGQVEAVVKQGLDNWFVQQLNAQNNDEPLAAMLATYDALGLSNAQVLTTYPNGAQLRKMAIEDGVIDKDSFAIAAKKEYRQELRAYMKQKGFKPQQDLFRQLINQKILRAAYSNNQLQEVLTDFWFNHFNVSLTKNQSAEFIPAYERDVIRPNVFGKFADLLLATAKSPAMLTYLDNFSSSGAATEVKTPVNGPARKRLMAMMGQQKVDTSGEIINKLQQAKKNQGLNENYAREVMELHTLGVECGYTQHDVTQAARVLTGWTLYPMANYGGAGIMKKLVERFGEDKLTEHGFVHDGDFLFAINRHDAMEKTVLGKKFASGGGYEEGVALLNMLAHHPSTAKFIARKLAVRFVSDAPPQSLIDKMTTTFIEKDGDTRQVLMTMVASPEFWQQEATRQKVKSPFELVISSVRAVNAEIKQPYQLFTWMERMGQKIYYYQAPTGFPDRGQYWINTGALLNRMNFGLALASQRIAGVRINLAALNHHHEPESAEQALQVYCRILIPERNLAATMTRLAPMLKAPDLVNKVDEAAQHSSIAKQPMLSMGDDNALTMDEQSAAVPGKNNTVKEQTAAQTAVDNNSMLAQVVGIILGSPEFQRR